MLYFNSCVQKCAAAPTAAMATAGGVSEKQRAAREKREAARLKIKELKALAMGKKEQGEDGSCEGGGTRMESEPPKTENTVIGKRMCVILIWYVTPPPPPP